MEDCEMSDARDERDVALRERDAAWEMARDLYEVLTDGRTRNLRTLQSVMDAYGQTIRDWGKK